MIYRIETWINMVIYSGYLQYWPEAAMGSSHKFMWFFCWIRVMNWSWTFSNMVAWWFLLCTVDKKSTLWRSLNSSRVTLIRYLHPEGPKVLALYGFIRPAPACAILCDLFQVAVAQHKLVSDEISYYIQCWKKCWIFPKCLDQAFKSVQPV